MKSLEVKKDIYWVGALDPDLRIFDIIMYTPYGTTYNSYIVKGSEKVALFETVKAEFFDEYLDRLQSLDVDITKIDYIVVDHTEPDHAGSVARILDLSPNAKVVGSPAAIKFMKKIANKPFESIVVGDGDSLNLGNKTLKFISAPFLHWPDSIYTYIPEDEMLITCDSFGSHYSTQTIFDDLVENEEHYMEALKYYFDCIFGPFKPYVLKALDKIKDLKISTVGTGHGPILRKNIKKIMGLYKEWSTQTTDTDGKNKVTISYVSAYGYTKSLALKISEGIKSKGEFEVKMYDVIHHEMGDILNDIADSDGILFGSPTINGDMLEPIRDVLTKLNPIVHGGKVAAAFGSYGWSGEAVPYVENRLRELKMQMVTPGLKINFKPSEEELDRAFNFGANFAEKIIEKINKKAMAPINGKQKKTRYWKCLICGQIFEGDSAPEICPVCGASAEQFVEVKSEDSGFKSESVEKFVVIGNGAAGFYAAEAIRKRNPKAKIQILSKEKALAYYRPQLSDYISSSIPDEEFYIAPEKWYEDNKVEQLLGVWVSSIKPENKKILLSDGTELFYDKLILANGSHNFMPPVKVACDALKTATGDLILTSSNYSKVDGVFTLRELEDADNIKDYLSISKKALIIGGGLLGLEAAWEMKKIGLEVTVVEFASRLLPRQLDNEGASLLKSIADKSGIELILGDSVEEIIADSCILSENNVKGKVIGVKLKSGKTLDTDVILFSVGIRPNKELAEQAGIKCDKGIIVNHKMETNIKDIYACGDVAELNCIVYGNWPAAIEMGKIAGANAVGDSLEFEGFVSSTIFKALDAEIFSAGTINFDDTSLQQLGFKDNSKGLYKKLFFKNGKLAGGILIGDTSKSAKVITGIQNEATVQELVKENVI